MSLVLAYSLFALIAILINLATQELSLMVYQGTLAIYVSIIAGTATGLVCKYALDKIYIFKYRSPSLTHDLNKFAAYSFTGIVTTLIFWSFELGFEFAFASKTMRYIGAVIGLTLGYIIKYRLDKSFVFSTKTG